MMKTGVHNIHKKHDNDTMEHVQEMVYENSPV